MLVVDLDFERVNCLPLFVLSSAESIFNDSEDGFCYQLLMWTMTKTE